MRADEHARGGNVRGHRIEHRPGAAAVDRGDPDWYSVNAAELCPDIVDGWQHLMGHVYAASFIERLKARVIIPHRYYIWGLVQRQRTLQTADAWVESYPGSEGILEPARRHTIAEVDKLDRVVHFFGDNVAFDKEAWLRDGR